MTKQDIGILISKMRATFPASYAKETPEETRKKMTVWYELFAKYPKEAVFSALGEYTMENDTPFGPTPGQLHAIINKHVVEKSGLKLMTKYEAWDKVVYTLRHKDIINGSQAAFNELPDGIKKAIGTPRLLRDWATMDMDKLEFVKRDFFERFEGVAVEEYDKLKSPAYTLSLLQRDLKTLEEPKEKI